MPNSGTVRQNSYENYSEGQDRNFRINRRAELVVSDFFTQMALDGRTFGVQIGTVDAAGGVNSTGTAPADTVVWALTDAASGTTIIPVEAQVAIETFTTGTLVNFMLEADLGKVRFSAVGGGGAFTAINTRGGGGARAAASTSYVNLTTGAGVTAAAKSTIGGVDGSYEFHNFAIEKLLDMSVGDPLPEVALTWRAKESGSPPIIVGPGSFVFHLACASADITATGGYRFIELPSESVT